MSPPSTELLGRDEDLHALTDLVRSERIVTVVGPGGVGKTTLARALLDRLEEAPSPTNLPTVYVVPLADVETPAAVRTVVARHLGLQDSGERRLDDMLGAGTAVVLLDNCEHVVDAAAAVAADLLEVPGLRVVATSREPLSVVGEHLFVLAPLAVPDDDDHGGDGLNPSVRLFLRRAAAAGAAPPLPHEHDDLVRLVRALDGLPLALELAAGRSRSLSVRDMADRLERGADLLRTAARGVPERHSSVEEVIDWSYRLLDEDERRLFLALSVCAAGADLAAVQSLGESAGLDAVAVTDVLDRLVGKSLVACVTGRRGARYEMLQMLRLFAAARRAADPQLETAVHEAHASHFAAACDGFQQVVRRAWAVGTFDLLLNDFDNIRTAASWCVAHDSDPDRSFRLVAPLFYLTAEMGSAEIAALAGAALAAWPGSRHPLASDVAGVQAEASIVLGRPDEASRAATAAVEAATSPSGVGFGHRALAQVVPDLDRALDHLRQSRSAAEEAGFRPLAQDATSVAIRILHAAGREDEAQSVALEAMESAGSDNVYAHAAATQDVGLMLLGTDATAAGHYVQVSHEEWTALGCPYGLMLSHRARGSVATARGDTAEAAGWLLEALRRVRRMGYRHEQATTVAAAVPLLARAGQTSVATALLAGLGATGADVERLHAPLLDRVGPELTTGAGTGQDAAAVRGRAMGMSELLDLAQHALREVQGTPAVPPEAAPVADHGTRALVRTGQLWRLTFDGTSVHLPAMKGLVDVAALLGAPGREIAVLDLAEPTGSPAVRAASDLGERIDGTARAAYRERIRALQADLDDADAAGDAERAATAQSELDALSAELAGAYGLSGPRRTGDPAERARAAVTARIRSAVARVAEVHPAAGAHLDRSIVTGRFCSYRPDAGTGWVVEA